MKKTLIALLALTAFGANAAYIQAHDPHVVAPFSLRCNTEVPIPPPSDDIYNPDGYYDHAIGKAGAELKSTLNSIITMGHKKLSYTPGVWDALSITDEDPNNPDNVILMYTGRSQSKASHGGGVDNWNREHTWAKSQGGFNTSSAMGYTDIHHLRPTDVSINGERGNYEFLEGGVATKESPEAGNKKNTALETFEPRDEVKGDVARMLFYMATRYEGSDLKTPDLELAIGFESGTAKIGDLCTLLRWNEYDAVDEFEFNRNTKIQKVQGNRNPFVDNPQWVNEIFDSEKCH
ncbi:endonuclease I family protein [Photobacterium profundum]|uniref:endonuclease I family protein n=1 Tax=Photobacterium profundum TaxID=74109 RepID=UPI003D0CA4B1